MTSIRGTKKTPTAPRRRRVRDSAAGGPVTLPVPAPAPARVVVLWQEVPQEHDYPAAGSYLSMLAAAKTGAG